MDPRMVRHQPASLLEASLGGVAQMVAQCAVRAARWADIQRVVDWGSTGELVVRCWCWPGTPSW